MFGSLFPGGMVPDGVLSKIPGYDPSSASMGEMPDQHNRDFGYGGQAIGELLGLYFGMGNPAAGAAGGMAGKKFGYGIGNMFAGRDAFNGSKGDFLDNFNPFSKYGATSIGQNLNMGQLPQTMMGGMMGGGGGLPGMGGLLPMGL